MSEHLKAHIPGASYFCTFTVVGPIRIGRMDVCRRKRCAEVVLDHIHNNPVEQGLVTLPEHYAHSSAHPESVLKMFGDEG